MKLDLRSAYHWMSLTLGRSLPHDSGQRRYQRFVQAAISAVAGKGIAAIVSFVSVPLTVHYLGVERYGVWIVISTFLVWLNLLDVGLGNGLTNILVDADNAGREDIAQSYIATALWSLVGVTVVAGVVFLSTWRWISWPDILNVTTAQARAETPLAVAAAILIFLAGLPLSIVPRILAAYQEGVIVNYWSAASNIASLLALLVVTRMQGGLVLLVIGFSGSILVVSVLSAIWLFVRHRPGLAPWITAIRLECVQRVIGTGGVFFVLQIAGLLLYYSDNFIIAHFLGADQVAVYSVTWRLFSYTGILQMLVFPYLWPAYTEAFACNDYAWVRRTFRTNILFSVSLTFVLALVLVLFGRELIALWAGPHVVPPFALLLLMGIWSVISVAMNVVACVLNGSGHIRGQMIYGSLTAAANIVLSIMLVQRMGIVGIIAATVIAYLVCNVVPASIETAGILRKGRT